MPNAAQRTLARSLERPPWPSARAQKRVASAQALRLSQSGPGEPAVGGSPRAETASSSQRGHDRAARHEPLAISPRRAGRRRTRAARRPTIAPAGPVAPAAVGGAADPGGGGGRDGGGVPREGSAAGAVWSRASPAVAIGTFEVTLREHLGGYRSHTVLLAVVPVVVLHSAVLLVASAFTIGAPLGQHPAAGDRRRALRLLFKLLRLRYLDAKPRAALRRRALRARAEARPVLRGQAQRGQRPLALDGALAAVLAAEAEALQPRDLALAFDAGGVPGGRSRDQRRRSGYAAAARNGAWRRPSAGARPRRSPRRRSCLRSTRRGSSASLIRVEVAVCSLCPELLRRSACSG